MNLKALDLIAYKNNVARVQMRIYSSVVSVEKIEKEDYKSKKMNGAGLR